MDLEPLADVLERARREPVSYQGFLMVRQRGTRLTKRGDPFLTLTLADASASVDSVLFSDHSAYGVISDPEVVYVAVRGAIENHAVYGLRLVIEQIRPVIEDDRERGFDEALMVPATPYDIDALWSEALELIDGLADEALRETVRGIFLEHEETLRRAPAARNIHQAYRGGLLEHSVMVARDAEYYARKYPELDADLLLAGALTHDLGKLVELTDEPPYDYTDDGRLLGHLYQGARMIERAAAETDLEPERARMLVHLILSHHGEREYGAVTTPKTREAVVLHYLDNIDAKLSIFRRYVAESGPGPWTAPAWELGKAPLWKGDEG